MHRGMDGAVVIRRYHNEPSPSPRPRSRHHVVRGFRPMDPANRPSPFKRYRNLERQPLPTDLGPPADAPTALDVLSGQSPPVTSAALDPAVLARLLFFSAGVTRYANEGERRTWFRASASAGDLHPLELYAACGARSGFDRVLYHFDPTRSPWLDSAPSMCAHTSPVRPATPPWHARRLSSSSPASPGGPPGSTGSGDGATSSGTRGAFSPTCWPWPPLTACRPA